MSDYTLDPATMKWSRNSELTKITPISRPSAPTQPEKPSTMPSNQPEPALQVKITSDQVDSLTKTLETATKAIMGYEGVGTIQSGRKETYGFREGNAGYQEVTNAVTKYGAGSKEATNAVADQLKGKLQAVGLPDVADAGMIASILSVSHMRGESGARAILNAVGSGSEKIEYSRKSLDPVALKNLQSMGASEFHTKLRQARELYDKTHYWNRTDSIKLPNGNTQTGRWGDLFGNGLIRRYNDEYSTFRKLSGV